MDPDLRVALLDVREQLGEPRGAEIRMVAVLQQQLLLDVLGEKPGALLVEDLNDVLRQRREPGIDEQQRNRDAESEHRGDHGLADAGRHELRIARSRLGDALEGDDHTDHGSYKTEQRACSDAKAQEGLEALQSRHLAQDRFGLRLDPRDALPHNNRGNAYINLEQGDLAIADLSEAIRLYPDYGVAYYNRSGGSAKHTGELT